jgi:predicted LPLAT superfamily acyltransferase
MKKKTKSTMKKGVAIGGAVTAAVLAAAAGAYFLSNKKTQKKAKAWVAKAKKDIAAKAKVAKKLGKEQYNAIVDEVVKQYGPLEKLTAKDVITAAKQLKAEWDNIQKHAKKLAKPMIKKVVRKPAKKAPAKKSRI